MGEEKGQRGGERKWEKPSIYWCTPQMVALPRAWARWKSGARNFTWVSVGSRTVIPGLSPTAFSHPLAGNWLGSARAGMRSGAHIECWCHSMTTRLALVLVFCVGYLLNHTSGRYDLEYHNSRSWAEEAKLFLRMADIQKARHWTKRVLRSYLLE